MRPYSMDLRKRVVAACGAREGTREAIAQRFGVSTAWMRRVLQRRRETGSIAPLPQRAGRKPGLNESIRAGDAVRKIEKCLEPLELGLSELLHVRPGIGGTEDRRHRDHEHVRQTLSPTLRPTRIGHV